jgi:HlyD family secretion protein
LQTVQATIQADQANVAKAQADLNYAQSNGKRMQDLAAQGVMSKDQGDLAISTIAQAQASLQTSQAQLAQAKSQYNQAQAQVSQAKAQIQANRGNVAMADTNLRYTTILSPIDGTVVARNVTVGQSVAASLQAPQVFVIAQDLKRMQLYAKTDESDTGAIKVGAEVTFQVDAFPNEQFRGRVSSIHLNATTVQNVVTYDTIIDFENPDEKLLPGETAYVTIPTGRAENALRIPNAALSYTPDLPFSDLQKLYKDNNIRREAYASHLGGWQVVWTQEGQDKKMTPHAVRVGITDYNTTELKEGNLQEGQQVITLQEGGSKAAGGGRNPLNPQQGRGGGGPGGGGRGGR